MARRSGMTAVLLLLAFVCLANKAAAGELGLNFAKDFGEGIKDGLSPGVGDFQEGLGEIISLLSNGDSSDIDIPPCSESHCYYMQFIAGCVVFGAVLMPILTFLCCCGFCCGRCCKACECCCRPCKQPACGGVEPTREQPYELWEKGLSFFCLFIAVAAMLSFSIVGFAAWMEVKSDYDSFWNGVVEVVDTPDDLLDEIDSAISDLQTNTKATLTTINEKFSKLDGPNGVETRVTELKSALATLREDNIKLQVLVEGCDNAWVGTCNPDVEAARSVGWTQNNACTGTATTHANRVASQLSGATLNSTATCPGGTCGCCQPCKGIETMIASFLSALPDTAEFNAVNGRIPVDDLQQELDNALGDWESQMEEMRDATSGLDDIRKDQQTYKDSLPESSIIGIGLGLFMLSWIVCACIMCAIPLSLQPEPTRKYGGYCWWTAFVIGVIYFTLILSPAFGWLTIPSVTFYDICQALPVQDGSTDNLLSMIPKDSQDDTLKRFLNDCLVKPSAYIWPLIDLEKTDITSQLDEFDKDASLSDNDIDAVTDVDAMTEAWNHPTTGAAAWFTQLNADTLGVNQRLQQTYYDYIDATLRPKIVTTDNAAVNTAITNLGTVGPAMKADFNEIKSSSKSTINGLVDDAWELGVCSKIYNPYNALRKPMCDGVAGSLLSTWACLFMLAWFQLFTLFLINKTYKIMYRDSVPFQGTQDFAGQAIKFEARF